MKFIVEVERNQLMSWAEDMTDEQLANLLRNSLEKGGFCYSAKVTATRPKNLADMCHNIFGEKQIS